MYNKENNQELEELGNRKHMARRYLEESEPIQEILNITSKRLQRGIRMMHPHLWYLSGDYR